MLDAVVIWKVQKKVLCARSMSPYSSECAKKLPLYKLTIKKVH